MDVVDPARATLTDPLNASSLDILEWAGRSPRPATRRNAVMAWIAVARETRVDSTRKYALEELVTAALYELKPGEVDRELLEFAATYIGKLEPTLRRSVTEIVLKRITESTVEDRRAAVLGQLLAVQGGLGEQARAYLAAASLSVRMIPVSVRDSLVPMFFLAGATAFALFVLCNKLANVIPIETTFNSSIFKSFACSLVAGLSMAAFTVPRPLLPSRRFRCANVVVSSLAVGIAIFLAFFVIPPSISSFSDQAGPRL